jgi:hypothetical protein
MNKKKIVWGIVGIIVLVAVFYEGVSYGKGQTTLTSPIGGQAFSGTRGTRGTGSFGGGFTVGQIIAKDTTSITVQLMAPSGANGASSTAQSGSKIVFFDGNTKITKTVDGTPADLAIGTQVSVSGTANSDGSVSAQTVQIRPNVPTTTTPASSNTTQ